MPEPIDAGGLRYHGMAPPISHIYELGMVEAIPIHQNECFDAAMMYDYPAAKLRAAMKDVPEV